MIRASSRLKLALPLLVLPVAALAQSTDDQTPKTGPEAPPPTGFWERDTLTGDWGGARKRLLDAGVTLGLQEQSELWGNMAGGLKQGGVYDGLTTASVKLDLEKLLNWTGATFFINANQFHGEGPSGHLVGNLQIVSNIEATPDTKLYQLWVEQKLLDGNLTIRIGQEGANDQMMISKYSALYLNSSFGFPGLPAADLPSGGPNYPMATPFARVEYHLSDHVTLVGAAFNGDPAPPGTGDPQLRDKGGIAFRLNDHVLSFGELWYSVNQGEKDTGLPATYKLGVWYDTSHFPDQLYDTNGLSLANPMSNGIPRPHSNGFAVYGIVDQMVWQKPGTKDQGIGVFLQVMGAPDAFNVSNLYVEAGINWNGPIPGRDKDTAGLAVSYLGIGSALRQFSRDTRFYSGMGTVYAGNETVVEMTYLCQLTPWWTVQPDLQLVVNPGANIPGALNVRPLRDAVISGVRTMITF